MRINVAEFVKNSTPGIGVLGMSLYVYLSNTYSNRIVKDYSVNKIAKVCGISWSTAKKAVKRLLDCGWACIKYGSLRLRSIKSKRDNIVLDKFKEFKYNRGANRHQGTIKELRYLLLAERAAMVQSHKDFIKDLYFKANPPEGANVPLDVHKRAKKLLAKMGLDAKDGYKDNGISWKCISEYVGCSLYLVGKIIKNGVGKIFKRIRRVVQLPRKYRPMWDVFYDDKELLKSILLNEKMDSDTSGGIFATRSNLYWSRTSLFRLLNIPILPTGVPT